MPKIIEIPGQGPVEFPDSMSDDQIVAAIKGVSAPAEKPQEKSMFQKADDKVRLLADYMTFGLADRLAASQNTSGLSYEEALAQERAHTKQVADETSTGGKIATGVAAAIPQMMIGGPVSLAAKGMSALSRSAPAAQPVANMMMRASAPTSTLGKAALGIVEGGGFGALEAAARDEDVASGAGVGAATGGAIPLAFGGIGRAISPVTNTLNAEQQRLVKEAAARGITLTPAQQTGNKMLNYAESTLREMPGGGMSPRAAQTEQMNNLMLKTAGVDDVLATPEVREQGFNAISNKFKSILSGEKVKFDQPMRSDVAKAVTEYSNRLDENVRPMFIRQADALLKGVREVGGDYAQNVRSDIARLEREYASNPSLSSAFGKLREAVDDAMTRSLPGDKSKALSEARGEWKNLLRIDEAMNRGGAAADVGNIPAAAVRSTVLKNGATPELDTLSRIGSVFMREPPNSGTQMRSYIANIAAGGAGGGAGYALGGPVGGAAGALAAPVAANAIYNNPLMRAYLTNQVGRKLERNVTPSFIRMGTQAGLGLLD